MIRGIRLTCPNCRARTTRVNPAGARCGRCRGRLKRQAPSTRIFWKKTEEAHLCELYAKTPTRDLVDVFRRSRNTIYQKAQKLGLKRIENIGPPPGWHGNSGSFRPGQPAWNLAKKGTHFSRATQFKKGNRPANTKYNGCIRIRIHRDHDGYLRRYKWIRLAKAKWVMLHVHNWRRAHRRVAKGSIVVFKDGNTMHCGLRNLRCITRIQHMAETHATHEYIAKLLALRQGGKGLVDRDLYRELLEHPEILDIKRKQLELNRVIEEVA